MNPAFIDSLPSAVSTPHGETIFELIGHSAGPSDTGHSVAVITLDPGCGSLRHYHPATEESYTILEGSGELELDAQQIPLRSGQAVLIPCGAVHQIANTGTTPLTMVVTCVPPWTPECSVFTDSRQNQQSPTAP